MRILCMAIIFAASIISNANGQDFNSRFSAVYFQNHYEEAVVPIKIAAFSIEELPRPKPMPVIIMTARMAMDILAKVPIGSVKEEIVRAAKLFNLNVPFMLAIAYIESSHKPTLTRTGKYVGLYQLSKEEFKKYGGGGLRTQARANAIAAAYSFSIKSKMIERITGKKPTFDYLYLMHQQGEKAAVEHISNPNRIAWRSMCATDEGKAEGERWCRLAIWGNTLPHIKRQYRSVERLTSKVFTDQWKERVNRGMIAQAL